MTKFGCSSVFTSHHWGKPERNKGLSLIRDNVCKINLNRINTGWRWCSWERDALTGMFNVPTTFSPMSHFLDFFCSFKQKNRPYYLIDHAKFNKYRGMQSFIRIHYKFINIWNLKLDNSHKVYTRGQCMPSDIIVKIVKFWDFIILQVSNRFLWISKPLLNSASWLIDLWKWFCFCIY